ncbi:MAG TPA: CBS domain-containing protein [Nitrospirae bacterium]|nr:CBS domain-containing protein [Nitrospirota bacterium]
MSDFNTLLAVKDLMAKDILTAPDSASIVEIAKALTGNSTGSVVIVSPDGDVVGIITESDIVSKVVAQAKDPAQTKAGGIMSSNLIKIAGDCSIFEARKAMTDGDVKHLIVEEDGKQIGVISSTSLGG